MPRQSKAGHPSQVEPAAASSGVLHSGQMRNAITVRLPEDLAEWLETMAARTGVSQGRIIREQLEKARETGERPFMRLAGRVAGPSDLSSRKGFSQK